jgi:hypothetical protein
MKKVYKKPTIATEMSFETSALACGKMTDPPAGSWHFSSAYDTFTGHLGGGMGGNETASGSVGVGFGPGGTSGSYGYSGLCGNWVTFTS